MPPTDARYTTLPANSYMTPGSWTYSSPHHTTILLPFSHNNTGPTGGLTVTPLAPSTPARPKATNSQGMPPASPPRPATDALASDLHGLRLLLMVPSYVFSIALCCDMCRMCVCVSSVTVKGVTHPPNDPGVVPPAPCRKKTSPLPSALATVPYSEASRGRVLTMSRGRTDWVHSGCVVCFGMCHMCVNPVNRNSQKKKSDCEWTSSPSILSTASAAE